MHPTFFAIGNLTIPTYTLLLDLGVILGLLLAYREGKRALGDGAETLDLALWAVVGGIIGGRLGYVLVNWEAFGEDWLRVLRLWEGGLSFHGAFLGGLAAIALSARLRGIDGGTFLCHLDALTPGLAVGIAFGWAACLMGGCAYGLVGQGLGYVILPDLYGVHASRFATQVVGLVFALLLLGIWRLRKRQPFAGAAFLTYGLLYFAGQFFLEFSRGDEALYLGPLRLAQVLDLIFVLAAATGLLLLRTEAQQDGQTEEGHDSVLDQHPSG